jgi:hypothetical protein
MNDHDPLDGPESHLRERMERAADDLPPARDDLVLRALARGRRQRTHRRLSYAAGGVAAATVLALTVPTFATDWGTGREPLRTHGRRRPGCRDLDDHQPHPARRRPG